MKKTWKIIRRIYWCITIVLLALAVSTATYAWFTSNHRVETDTATARSGSEELTLQISEQGADSFTPVDNATIVQVNQTAADYLLPVSTTDLTNFVYNDSTVENQARSFQLVENERYYYHGRIYLRAQAQEMTAGTHLALYLDEADEAGGAIVQTTAGELLSVARLGLVIGGAASSPVVFRLADEYNSSGTAMNTFLNGTQLNVGEVLSWDGSRAVSQADPSTTIDQYTIQMSDTGVTLPNQPLAYLEYNQIYPVDIYFYIEGCDPDCVETVYQDSASLHLAFYGMVVEE